MHELFPGLKGNSYKDSPEKFCPNADSCLVTLHKIEFVESNCLFHCEIMLSTTTGKIVNLLANGIASPRGKFYALSIPTYNLGPLFDLILEETIVEIRHLADMHKTVGGENAMYSVLKNISTFVDAAHGALYLLESCINELKVPVEELKLNDVSWKIAYLQDVQDVCIP